MEEQAVAEVVLAVVDQEQWAEKELYEEQPQAGTVEW